MITKTIWLQHIVNCVISFAFTISLILLMWDLEPAAAKSGCPNITGKTISWIVPYSSGGGYDVYSRLLTPYYAKNLAAKIKVENITGAGGLIGARRIAEAPPDGLTMGLINVPGIIAAYVSGVHRTPNAAKDMSILGRLAFAPHVLLTGRNSTLKNNDDIFDRVKKRPLLYAITDVGGTAFLNVAIINHLLGLKAQYVAGYRGTRQTTMAVMRGEVDLVSAPFNSVIDRLESGDLRAVLQISTQTISPHPALSGVDVVGGPTGLAALRARQLRRDPTATAADADALAALSQSGRLVVAPAGLNPALLNCLQIRLAETMLDPELNSAAAKAKRPLHPADAETARHNVITVMTKAKRFAPIIKAAIKEVRK